MFQKIKKTSLVLLILLILLTIISCSNTITPSFLAKCLTEKGGIMYGTNWCAHCQNQKKMFGEEFKLIDFIDCDQEREKCSAAGIRGYPTWNINGKNYPGEKTLATLAQLSGCNN